MGGSPPSTLAGRWWSAADEGAAAVELERRRQTDGLPIVVPTVPRVERMLLATPLDPDVILGEVGPGFGVATVEKVAVNAVMAGCHPDVFPVVVAAVEAVCDPAFSLAAVQATTHPLGPVVFVNGPARDRCGVAWGVGALGPGHRANLTIGRALRLVLMNIGGGVPGVGDMASLGSPAKLACCMAEDEGSSPFEPLHVSLGFEADDSVVTVLGGESPHSIFCSFAEHADPDVLLRILASAMTNAGSNNVHVRTGVVGVILNPLHAKVLSEHGMTRSDVQAGLFDLAAVRRGDLRAIAGAMVDELRGKVDPGAPSESEDDLLRVVSRPEDILVLVGGDEGGAYSAWIPTWGGGDVGNVAISRPIRFDEACEVPVSRREP